MIGPADAAATAATALVITLIAILALPPKPLIKQPQKPTPAVVEDIPHPITLRMGDRSDQNRLRAVEENLDTQSIRIKEINQKLDLILTPESKTDAARSRPR